MDEDLMVYWNGLNELAKNNEVKPKPNKLICLGIGIE